MESASTISTESVRPGPGFSSKLLVLKYSWDGECAHGYDLGKLIHHLNRNGNV